jgi:hypothetical protein
MAGVSTLSENVSWKEVKICGFHLNVGLRLSLIFLYNVHLKFNVSYVSMLFPKQSINVDSFRSSLVCVSVL